MPCQFQCSWMQNTEGRMYFMTKNGCIYTRKQTPSQKLEEKKSPKKPIY